MFLRGHEANLIRRDARQMILNSAEAADILIEYRQPVGTVVHDTVYDAWTADSWQPSLVSGVKAIQQVIKTKDEDILRWGVLEPGDCIFWFDVGVDLSSIGYDDAVIRVQGDDLQWIPVPRKLKSFNNYITLRVGNSSVMQPIACKIKQ